MTHNINTKGDIQVGRGNTANAHLQSEADKYLADLKARKYTPGSIKKRRDSLRKFLLYLEQTGINRFQDVDLKTLEAYRLCLIDHEYSDYCIESDLRAVQLCFQYLEEQGLLFENPAQWFKIRKAPVNLGIVLTEREVNKMLSVPDTSTYIGLRDRAILEVLYSTAMRRGELKSLKLHDIDLDRATVRVTKGKGGKQRLLPLGKQAVKFLRLYLEQVRPRYLPKFAAAPDALWLCPRRKAVGLVTINTMIRRCGKLAGIKKPVDTHTMRRTCATHMLRGGAHPVVVAELLGHAGLKTLSHYLRTSIKDLQHAHAQSKPGR